MHASNEQGVRNYSSMWINDHRVVVTLVDGDEVSYDLYNFLKNSMCSWTAARTTAIQRISIESRPSHEWWQARHDRAAGRL